MTDQRRVIEGIYTGGTAPTTRVPSQPAVLPAPDDWNAAVQHSIDNPTHVLVPYTDDAGVVQMECLGYCIDPYEPSVCGFDTRQALG